MIVEPQISPIGQYAPDFELPGVDDQVHHLARYLEQFAFGRSGFSEQSMSIC